jgi:hypothetical protein
MTTASVRATTPNTEKMIDITKDMFFSYYWILRE